MLLALFFALYPAILIFQLLTDTVTESIGQIAVLLILSVIAWVWIIRLYRAFRSVGLRRHDAALDNCDIAMALRIQMERQDEGLFPSIREYHMQYGITAEHLERHPDLLIMHPGPVNRGVELANEVVDHERAIILSQVTNGVALRMAVLYLLAPQREEA